SSEPFPRTTLHPKMRQTRELTRIDRMHSSRDCNPHAITSGTRNAQLHATAPHRVQPADAKPVLASSHGGERNESFLANVTPPERTAERDQARGGGTFLTPYVGTELATWISARRM